MSFTEHDSKLGDVSEKDAKVELDRLLSDARFRVTDRHKEILKYLSKLHFQRVEGGAKAYSIAIDVLGRPCNFEPSLDPIVRIEMSRLRSALDDYYNAFGHESAVWLQLPRGRYLVRFTEAPKHNHQRGVKADCDDVTAEAERGIQVLPTQYSPRLGRPVITGACVGVIGSLLAAFWYLAGSSNHEALPSVTIEMNSGSDEAHPHALLFLDNLQAAMLRFDTLALGRPNIDENKSSDYQIAIKFSETDTATSVSWTVIEGRARQIIDAGAEEISTQEVGHDHAEKRFAAMLALRFANRDGAIGNAEVHHAGRGALGNACVLRAYRAVRTQDAAEVRSATECLEKTVASDPPNATATAFLSKVLSLNPEPTFLKRASYLAEQAVVYDPSSDVAQLALAKSHFANGRLDAAIGAARRAFANNPANPDVVASLSLYYFSRGDWQNSVEMSDLAFELKAIPPTDAILAKALDAFRHEDWIRAARLSDEISSRSKVAPIVRAAALVKMNNTPGTIRNLAELRERYPDLSTEGVIVINAQLYPAQFSELLRQGLNIAAPETTASIH